MEKIQKHDKRSGRDYLLTTASNGLNYVMPTLEDGALPILHIASGNTKTGNDHVLCYGHSIPLTCDNTCECFTEKVCYGCSGNYVRYPVNQLYLADNLLYLMTYGYEAMTKAIIDEIKRTHCKYYRWFTVGDIRNLEFIEMMVNVGKACPNVKFWGYTKKYMLVNHYIETRMNGDAETFLKLTGLIFSHWRNKDGSFFKAYDSDCYELRLLDADPGAEYEESCTDEWLTDHTFTIYCEDETETLDFFDRLYRSFSEADFIDRNYHLEMLSNYRDWRKDNGLNG